MNNKKQINNEIAKKILDMYISHNEICEKLCKYIPFKINEIEYISTTDAYQVIYFPISEQLKEIAEYDENKTVNIAKVLPTSNENIIIDIYKLKQSYDNIPIVDLDVVEDCPSCDGMGEFDHYNETYACKYCYEKGYFKTGTKKGKDISYLFDFNECYITMSFIEDLLRVINYTETTELKIDYLSKTKTRFILDDYIHILIMAKSPELSYEGKEFTFIKIL